MRSNKLNLISQVHRSIALVSSMIMVLNGSVLFSQIFTDTISKKNQGLIEL